jgi:ribosome-binding protein aMBF1 (putative translation factor)
MTPDQVRAARVLLGWSLAKLRIRSSTSAHMVKTFERTGRVAPFQNRTNQVDPLVGIRATLEAAGA